jgi:hypothetical protein
MTVVKGLVKLLYRFKKSEKKFQKNFRIKKFNKCFAVTVTHLKNVLGGIGPLVWEEIKIVPMQQ